MELPLYYVHHVKLKTMYICWIITLYEAHNKDWIPQYVCLNIE